MMDLNAVPQSQGHKRTETIPCPLCQFTAPSRSALRIHLAVHYNLHSRVKNSSQLQNKQRTLRCRQCGFEFHSKPHLWQHMQAHIPVDRMLFCPTCPFVTQYRHHLEYHTRTHTGFKPYSCNQCSYTCVNKSMLTSHLKSHSNVYGYRCKDCVFMSKYCHSLKVHLCKYGHRPQDREVDAFREHWVSKNINNINTGVNIQCEGNSLHNNTIKLGSLSTVNYSNKYFFKNSQCVYDTFCNNNETHQISKEQSFLRVQHDHATYLHEHNLASNIAYTSNSSNTHLRAQDKSLSLTINNYIEPSYHQNSPIDFLDNSDPKLKFERPVLTINHHIIPSQKFNLTTIFPNNINCNIDVNPCIIFKVSKGSPNSTLINTSPFCKTPYNSNNVLHIMPRGGSEATISKTLFSHLSINKNEDEIKMCMPLDLSKTEKGYMSKQKVT